MSIKSIVYRHLTDADFFNINKPRGAESGGGGQAYIDFPAKAVSVDEWSSFFAGTSRLKESAGTQGPAWTFPIKSIGVNGSTNQILKVYQRRAESVSIASQKLHSRQSNRVKAWHPDNGFPRPVDESDRNQCPEGLIVYMASTFGGNIWAGWYLNDGTTPLPTGDQQAKAALGEALFGNESAVDGACGILTFNSEQLALDTSSLTSTFISGKLVAELTPETQDTLQAEEPESPEEEADSLFELDISTNKEPEITERVVKTRERNKKFVNKLKQLYKHECQVTGTEHLFKKKDGINYTEAHHLVPLGDGGADSPENLVILSPIIHRMLHYAKVKYIDLNDMLHLEDGSALLELEINDKAYTIEYKKRARRAF